MVILPAGYRNTRETWRENTLGECVQAGSTGGVTGQAGAANQTDTHRNMAPSQQLELDLQFNWCCVLPYATEFSPCVSHVGQAAYLFSEALWLCCPVWWSWAAVMCQIWYPLLTRCLLLWLTQNELRKCKVSSQWAVKKHLDCVVTSAETAYAEIGFFCRGPAAGVHTSQQKSRYLRLLHQPYPFKFCQAPGINSSWGEDCIS